MRLPHTVGSSFVTLLALAVTVAPSARAQSWTAWSGPVPCMSSGTVEGSIAGITDVAVTGTRLGYQLQDGTTCGAYPTTSQFSGYTAFTHSGLNAPYAFGVIYYEAPTSNVTVTFAQAVVNPYLAIGSLSYIGNTVSLDFGTSAFSVVANNTFGVGGTARHGYGTYQVNGNVLSGQEFTGVLKFEGTYSSLSFSVTNPEQWTEFTVGADKLAVVPEPSSVALLASGLGLGVAITGWRRRIKRAALSS